MKAYANLIRSGSWFMSNCFVGVKPSVAPFECPFSPFALLLSFAAGNGKRFVCDDVQNL
jgi:hypothetical protein